MAAHQALLPLGFSRQEHWSGLQFPVLFRYPLITTNLFSVSMSVFLLYLFVHLFLYPHTSEIIYLSSDLFHLARYLQGPAILSQMVGFEKYSTVYVCVCVCMYLLYPFIQWWILRLLPLLDCCKQCCSWLYGCIYLFKLVFLYSWGKYLKVE